MPMGRVSMSADEAQRKPLLLVFAGPNGSGKTTVTRALKTFGTYVNADDLKNEYGLTDIEAAQRAETLRYSLLERNLDFSFETVLSTDRNLLLLQRAKSQGYEIQCVYVLTCDENINVARVRTRKMAGGHDVPEEKIRRRYHRALALLPHLLKVCDSLLIYDNTDQPALIFCKRGMREFIYPNSFWSEERIKRLLKL